MPSRTRVVVRDGVHWRIHEAAEGQYDRRHGRPDLIFEADAAMRRVRDYPENWYELSDDDLIAISWRR